MISHARYEVLKERLVRYSTWVDGIRGKGGWASYRREDVPKGIPRLTNAQLGAIEVYEFVHDPPDRYFCYVERQVVSAGVVDAHKVRITTGMGQTLGYGYLGTPYKCLGSIRYPVRFTGINLKKYHGIFFHGAGQYARVRQYKKQKV